ncbi:plasmid maintenance protein [Borrelia sp. RT1S]|uniref:plasmid maintenance protein n=1 Tax=Borrelia sp. RT1S TaxID=2898580 RepID=UPI001E2E583E|nr:plasmid maintenance protein [Borrelia sp. RT1S]UGQ17903.1 plasmid maintenance protein [Borrelia sp. RT1S]
MAKVSQPEYYSLVNECSSKKQTNLIILVSTLDFVNNKHKQYTQKYLYHCFAQSQKRFSKKAVSQETFRKYLYTLAKLEITDNYCHRKGKQKGSEIRYTLLHKKTECHKIINDYFQKEKEKSFSKKFDAYNKKFSGKNTYVKYQCFNNKNNNIGNIENRKANFASKHSRESFTNIANKEIENANKETRYEKYANKCEFMSFNILNLISKLDTTDKNKINHLKNYKRIELECGNMPTSEIEGLIFPIIENNYENPYYLCKFNDYGCFSRIVEYFNGDKNNFEVKNGTIYKKNKYKLKDFDKKRTEALQELLDKKKHELVKEKYRQEDLDTEFTKLFNKYKTKPHFILENKKYNDLSKFIEYFKNNYPKVKTKEEIEVFNRNALFSIILDNAIYKYPHTVDLRLKVRNHIAGIEKNEGDLFKDNTYLKHLHTHIDQFMDKLKSGGFMHTNDNGINTLRVANNDP